MENFNNIQTPESKISTKMGIEVHVTLSSAKKIFNFNKSSSNAEEVANSVGTWELGYLGTLPLLNSEVIQLALKTCLFLNAEISKNITFDRKIYNYFDLSKGFQITQQNNPIGRNGRFNFVSKGQIVGVPINRIQLEEDTARTSYERTEIMLDFNRSGNSLLEIVTDPVFSDVESVVLFIKNLQNNLDYLGISKARMEKGELRVDLNLSFSFDDKYKTPRYEIKNLNSIKNLKNSFSDELKKHKLIYKNRKETKCTLESETLGFDERLCKTFVQRKKTDYLYLPESNIPVISITEDEISALKSEMPASPLTVWSRINEKFNLKYSELLFEKPSFNVLINSLEKANINYLNDFDSFASFFLNYISTKTQEMHDKDEIYNFFREKGEHLWNLFILFQKRLIAKEKISILISSLSTQDSNYPLFQWEDFLKQNLREKKENDSVDINREISLILEEKKISKKLISQPTRLTGLILGVLKGKFPSQEFDYQEILKIVTRKANDLLE